MDVFEDADGDGLTDTEETSGYSSYQLIEGNYTWEQAKVDAESRGGQLAVIRNSADNLYIQKLIESGGEAWIGASDSNNEGNYAWITNEPWQFDGRDENVSNRAENYFNFDHFPPELNDFELSGVASYLTDSTLSPYSNHKRLRLVPAQSFKSGKAIYGRKLNLRDGFEVNTFWQTTVPNNDSSGADYFRIAFGDSSKFAIVFDTYRNVDAGEPSNAMVRVNGLVVDLASKTEFAYIGGDLSNRGKTADPYAVKIKYENGKFSVWLDGNVVITDHVFDLSSKLAEDGTGFIEANSFTGSEWENHDILSWSFNALGESNSTAIVVGDKNAYWSEHSTSSLRPYILETKLYSNPLAADTDDDGFDDGIEFSSGSDLKQFIFHPFQLWPRRLVSLRWQCLRYVRQWKPWNRQWCNLGNRSARGGWQGIQFRWGG